MVVRKRLDIQGRAFAFVTTTSYDWMPYFRDNNIALLVLHKLEETLDFYRVSLVGYVLMPTHLHMLLGFQSIELLSKFMQSFKILSSKAVKAYITGSKSEYIAKECIKFWKPRFDDLIIKSEKQFRIKLEYIHNNPVKAGLITNSYDWEYSSAGDWLENKTGIISIDKNFNWLG